MKNKKRGIKITLSNKLYYSLITIVAVILITAGVYAWTAGGTGNPGHSIQDVAAPSNCDEGEYLSYRYCDDATEANYAGCTVGSGYWTCVSTVTPPSTYVRNVEYMTHSFSKTGTSAITFANCSTGKSVLGGGCSISDISGGLVIKASNPSGEAWRCWAATTGGDASISITAYAICANVD